MCGGCTVMPDCLPRTWRDRRSNHISQAPACCRSKSTGAQKGHPPFRRRWTLVSPCRRHTASDRARPFRDFWRNCDDIDNPGNMLSFLRPGARDGRPLRGSCGGDVPCLKMTLAIPLEASARSFPRCAGRCQSVSSSHRKRCRIVGSCRRVLHVSRRLALSYRACRRMLGSPHSGRRLKSQHFEVRQAVSYLAFLANAPDRPKQPALLRKQPSVAFSRWLLKYIEFPIDVIGHSRTPESSFARDTQTRVLRVSGLDARGQSSRSLEKTEAQCAERSSRTEGGVRTGSVNEFCGPSTRNNRPASML
ncbi:hypothetical protein C8K18_11410 [Paraburkholderia sp. GV068]|nr:hypothetical protein C8K19_110266 [Paraburkholderia sp. GV072]PUB00749.1 hypothetical protein C8K18_11410 [Paraburkholderia sp. GV068]